MTIYQSRDHNSGYEIWHTPLLVDSPSIWDELNWKNVLRRVFTNIPKHHPPFPQKLCAGEEIQRLEINFNLNLTNKR